MKKSNLIITKDVALAKVAALAKMAALVSADTASCFGMHQPQIPKKLEK